MQSLSSDGVRVLKYHLDGKLTKTLNQFYSTAVGGKWGTYDNNMVRSILKQQEPTNLSNLFNTVLTETFDVDRPAKSCIKAAKFVGETAVGLALYPVATTKTFVAGMNRVVNPEEYAGERGGVTSPAFTMLTGAVQALTAPVLGLATAVLPTLKAGDNASARQWRNDVSYHN